MDDQVSQNALSSEPTPSNFHTAWSIFYARKAYNRVGLGMLSFLLVPTIVSIFVQLLVSFLFSGAEGNPFIVWGNQIFSMYLVAAPICLLIIGEPPESFPKLEKRSMSFLQLFIIFCIMETVAIFGSQISNLLISIADSISGTKHTSPLDELLENSPLFLIFLVVVIIGPIIEELICRQAIMRRLLPFGEKSAICISALCFGIIHENFYQLFYAVGLGILLGYVYARTNRLLYVCGLHILFNFCGSFLPMLLTMGLDITELENMPATEYYNWFMQNAPAFLGTVLYSLIIYGLALTGLILFIILFRKATFEPCLRPLPQGRRGATYFGNVGMILFLIVGALMLGLSLIL